MGLFGNLFGSGAQAADLVAKGAKVLDVRTPGEFQGGHVKGSVNIPVQELGAKIEQVKKWNTPVVTVCASGMRSGKAASMLKKHGIEAVNGGAWTNLN